jgi:hypothetical protein
MIRRLTLKNWRNYQDVTVEFGVGTTFVVASNGMGKTSLVEAARWALFGTIVPGGNAAIRAGAVSALAIVELQLPDQRVLSVERTLTGKPRSATPLPTVRLDGAPVPHEQLDRHLISAYRAEPGFLAGLTMPAVDRDRDKPSALGLEEHLGQYYGIGGLRNAAEQLKAKRKAIEARIKRLKNANSSSAQRFAQLRRPLKGTRPFRTGPARPESETGSMPTLRSGRINTPLGLPLSRGWLRGSPLTLEEPSPLAALRGRSTNDWSI